MEWISFTLDSDKKLQFENELMPKLCHRYGSLIDMANQTWLAYYQRQGINTYYYAFCSDSVILLKFVKEFANGYTQHFTTPKIQGMERFGPQELGNLNKLSG